MLLVRGPDGHLSQFRRWLRLALREEPWLLGGREYPVQLGTSFRAWQPEVDRDLLWWLQDQYRWEVREEIDRRLTSLEAAMAGSGQAVGHHDASVWVRLHRAEEALRLDPQGSGALSRRGLDDVLATLEAPYAIAFADLDGLRDFNAGQDNWDAGDAALAVGPGARQRFARNLGRPFRW